MAAVAGTSGVTVLVVEGSTLAVQRTFPGIRASIVSMVSHLYSTGGVRLETKSNDIEVWLRLCINLSEQHRMRLCAVHPYGVSGT